MAMALAVSCVKPDFEFNPENIQTSAGGTVTSASDKTISVLFTEQAGNVAVEIDATSDWTAEMVNTRADGWCRIDPSSGSKGVHKIYVNVSANTDFSDRKAIARICCGDVVRNIDITQKQKNSLTLTSDRFEIPADGGYAELTVKTNVDFSWEQDEASKGWVSPVRTKALREETLVFAVAANEDTDRREATLTIVSETGRETVKIYQEGSKPSIVISGNEYAVSDGGGVFNVDVSSNVKVECRIPKDCDWLREVLTKSLSTCTFIIEADPNPNFEPRYAEVSFVNVENGLSEKIYVTQVQKDALVVACDRYDLGFRGGEITVGLGHNVDYRYDIDVDWIKPAATKAYTEDRLVFTVDENKDDSPREGIILFTSGDGRLSQTVKVCQAQADKIIISDLEKNISDRGGNFEIEIKSNIEYGYRIVQDGNWLHDASTKAATSRTLQFSADANDSYEPRQAQIVVTSTDGSFTGTVTVTQMQKDALVVADTRYDIGQEGGEISIRVGHNVNFTTSIDCGWIDCVTTRAFTEDILKFTVAANQSPDSREAAIVFTGKDGALSQTVKVCQAQKDQLIVGDTSKSVSDEGGRVDIEVRSNVNYSFRIVSGSEWLHAVTTKGLTSRTVSFIADPNDSYDYREARVDFTSGDGSLSQSVLIGQVQNDAIVISTDRIDADNAGDEFTVRLGHNVDYTLTINGEWITPVKTKAYTEETLRFAVAANIGEDSREGSLVFKSKDGKITQTVKVIQSACGKIVLSETEKAVSDAETFFDVEIRANVDYTYKIEQTGTWLSEVKTRAMSSKTLSFKAAANTGYEARVARIVVSSTDGKVSNTLTVTQMQKDALVIATGSYDVPCTGGEISVKIGHNIDFTTETDVDWITPAKTKAYTEETLKFNVAENSSDQPRTGYITFTGKGGELTQKIKVVQACPHQLIIEKKEFSIGPAGGQIEVEVKSDTDCSFKISKDANWIREAAPANAVSTRTVRFTVDANNSYDSRSATITFTTSDGALKETVTVSQLQKDGLIAQTGSYTIGNSGGELSVKVNSNVNFQTEVTQGKEWISIVSTKALTTKTIKLNIAANSSGGSRTGKVRVFVPDTQLSEEITIVQEDRSVLVITHRAVKNVEYRIPAITGSGLTGTITWGDGASEAFSATASHSYKKDGNYSTTVEVTGAASFQCSIAEFSAVDISGF